MRQTRQIQNGMNAWNKIEFFLDLFRIILFCQL